MPPPLKGQSVTHVSGIRCYLSLRKDNSRGGHARQALASASPSAHADRVLPGPRPPRTREGGHARQATASASPSAHADRVLPGAPALASGRARQALASASPSAHADRVLPGAPFSEGRSGAHMGNDSSGDKVTPSKSHTTPDSPRRQAWIAEQHHTGTPRSKVIDDLLDRQSKLRAFR